MADLDQSGSGWQWVRVNLGPTLGWSMVQVHKSRTITAPGAVTLDPGDSVVFVNALGLVTINLPDVTKWILEQAGRPVTGFERAIWIKDLAGHASAFNITVDAFGSQTIDLSPVPVIMAQNYQLLRLYPINDLTGWFVG